MAEPTEADYWKAARLCTEDRAVRSEAIAQALAAARAEGVREGLEQAAHFCDLRTRNTYWGDEIRALKEQSRG